MDGSIETVTADPRWAAVATRNREADGSFFYAVRTTGVYCRPSCGARQPRPENVTFYASAAAAALAGFRPCKRCRPDAPADEAADRIARVCRFIEASEELPSLEALAAQAGLSRFHLHRSFKAVTGLTPRAYAAGHRARRLQTALRTGASVTDALYETGFGSAAAFYRSTDRALGMTPRAYRAGGPAATIRYAVGESSLGRVLIAATERGVCAILLGSDAAELERELGQRFPRAARLPGGDDMAALVQSALALVENPAASARLPLDLQGTAFQLRVWEALTRIPAGQTTTYSALAAAIGAPTAARAVARACATNHVAVAVPCHRVIRGDGGLSGYRWGVERKRALLDRERR